MKNTRFVVFKAMINFLYTDHLNVAPFFAPEVSALAIRFGLPRLQGLAQQLFLRSKNESVQLPPSTFSEDLADLLDQPVSFCCFLFLSISSSFSSLLKSSWC